MKLSIIICVYNTKREYLEKCLHSITASSLRDFEIVLIDDGSTLDYSDLVQKYSLSYTKTENRGIFKARALGVELANGDYIAFCDSDDTVSSNYHLPMVMKAQSSGADIVMNDWAYDYGAYRYYLGNDSTITNTLYANNEETLVLYTEKCGREHSYYVLWNKIYAANLLKSAMKEAVESTGNIERYNYAEDVLINFFAFKQAKNVLNVHTGFYFYRIHPEQTVAIISADKLRSQADLMMRSLTIMLSGIGENSFSEEIAKNIMEWKKHMSRFHYLSAVNGGHTDCLDYLKERYEVELLELPHDIDKFSYKKKMFIGENFEHIDKLIRALYEKEGKRTVSFPKDSTYETRFCNYIMETSAGEVTCSENAEFVIPKNSISLKVRLFKKSLLSKVPRIPVYTKKLIRRAFRKR